MYPTFSEISCQVPLYGKCNGLIFVIDSSDNEKFKEVKIQIDKLLLDVPELDGYPIVFFINKLDLPNSTSVDKLRVILELDKNNNNTTTTILKIEIVSFKI